MRCRTGSIRPSRGSCRLAEETPAQLPRLRPAQPRRREPARIGPSASGAPRSSSLVSGLDGAAEEGPGGWTAGSIELTPLTLDPEAAAPWLETGEGVIAKELDAPYRPGKRKGMSKIKRLRTIDAVVAGWRPGKEENTVGSLMLGLYDNRPDGDGELHVIGHTSGLKAAAEARAGRDPGAVRDR